MPGDIFLPFNQSSCSSAPSDIEVSIVKYEKGVLRKLKADSIKVIHRLPDHCSCPSLLIARIAVKLKNTQFEKRTLSLSLQFHHSAYSLQPLTYPLRKNCPFLLLQPHVRPRRQKSWSCTIHNYSSYPDHAKSPAILQNFNSFSCSVLLRSHTWI